MVGKEALPTSMERGNSRFTAAPLQLPFAQDDHERRQRIA